MDKLYLPKRQKKEPLHKYEFLRVSGEAYEIIAEMSIKTALPMIKIVDRICEFALEHAEYVAEVDEEDEAYEKDS